MSEKSRSPKSVAKLAYAFCILSSGAATAGDIAPKLLKTTTPIRVKSSASDTVVQGDRAPATSLKSRTVTAKKAVAAPPTTATEPAAHSAYPLRVLLEPHRSSELGSGVAQTSGGVPRTNHFFELQNDRAVSDPASLPVARSAAIPQRTRPRGAIRKNPLVADAPPTLRRFDVDEKPLNLPVTESPEHTVENLVIREEPLPARPVDDLDQTFDILSIDASENTAVLGAAKDRGFGMLAIDQIGQHMEPAEDGETTIAYPPLQRFATDLVLPDDSAIHSQAQRHHTLGQRSPNVDASNSSGHFRQQLGSLETQVLVDQYTPQLPAAQEQQSVTSQPTPSEMTLPPTQPKVAAITPTAELAPRAARPETMVAEFFDAGALNTGLSTPIVSAPEGQVALEVDDLLAASSRRVVDEPTGEVANAAATPTKRSFAQRLSSWSKRLGPKNPSGESHSSTSQSVSTRLPTDQNDSDAAPSQRRRSGGILTQWLNRSR